MCLQKDIKVIGVMKYSQLLKQYPEILQYIRSKIMKERKIEGIFYSEELQMLEKVKTVIGKLKRC